MANESRASRVLLVNPDIVLLDEPTNHLDIESILWLEGYLQEFGGSAIIISHDRAFFDAVTNRRLRLLMVVLVITSSRIQNTQKNEPQMSSGNGRQRKIRAANQANGTKH